MHLFRVLSGFLVKNKITNLTEADSSRVRVGHLKFQLAFECVPGGGLCETHCHATHELYTSLCRSLFGDVKPLARYRISKSSLHGLEILVHEQNQEQHVMPYFQYWASAVLKKTAVARLWGNHVQVSHKHRGMSTNSLTKGTSRRKDEPWILPELEKHFWFDNIVFFAALIIQINFSTHRCVWYTLAVLIAFQMPSARGPWWMSSLSHKFWAWSNISKFTQVRFT